MRLRTKRALFLVECLDLEAATQVEEAKWEAFQIRHLNDDSVFRIEDKSRQIAWSWTVAAEAVAKAVLDGESTAFVSINLEEAKEKIRYARRIYDSLQIAGLPKLTGDNVLQLEFEDDVRIMSLPSRPPRGKARMNIVLDEFAHVMHDREIYRAALPIISKGGIIRLGSSPMGARGVHWELSRQELQAYPSYTRSVTPWWRVAAFCKDGVVARAESLSTAQRVERYGNERIQGIFESMLMDDFQQEYECTYVDETVSFFTWETIRKNQADILHYVIRDPADVHSIAREMKGKIAAGEIESVLVGGMDVGRKRDLTEIMLVGAIRQSTPVRLMVSLDRVEFDKQEEVVRTLLQILPVSSFLIDQNGIGMHLAERLSQDTVAEGVTFTNASKALWATTLKMCMERGHVPIPPDRDLAYQIHSIKKTVTAAANNVFDTDANEKHHADKMWALALAVTAATDLQDAPEYGTAPGWQRRTG